MNNIRVFFHPGSLKLYGTVTENLPNRHRCDHLLPLEKKDPTRSSASHGFSSAREKKLGCVAGPSFMFLFMEIDRSTHTPNERPKNLLRVDIGAERARGINST
jgi:hypothetical protein